MDLSLIGYYSGAYRNELDDLRKKNLTDQYLILLYSFLYQLNKAEARIMNHPISRFAKSEHLLHLLYTEKFI